jgi:hypothetical protein
MRAGNLPRKISSFPAPTKNSKRSSFWPHEFAAALTRLSDQHFALRRNDLFRLTQIVEARFVAGHGSLRLIRPPSRLQGMTEFLAANSVSCGLCVLSGHSGPHDRQASLPFDNVA